MTKATIGQKITKNNSSRNNIVIVRVVARPMFMPSRLRKIMLNALPPTDDGVIAEVNSHKKVVRHVALHFSSRSVRLLKRHAMPKSRIPTATNAAAIAAIVTGVMLISRRASILNSLLKSHTTTARPITIGIAIFQSKDFRPLSRLSESGVEFICQ